MSVYSGRCVLILGGAGSLGCEVTRHLLAAKVKAVRLFDLSENALFWAQYNYGRDPRTRFLLGDVCDRHRLRLALDGVDLVVNSAARKHVGIGEHNPFEVIKTNVNGLQTSIESVLEVNQAAKFIHVSSDKAVSPRGIYSVTKLLGERLVLDAENYKGDRKTAFVVLRPCNYFRSSGNVLEIWERQKKLKQPLTVTHPEMKRWFIDYTDMMKALDECVEKSRGGEIWVPRLAKEYSILDLAKKASKHIQITSPKKGEALAHDLLSSEERGRAVETDFNWVIR